MNRQNILFLIALPLFFTQGLSQDKNPTNLSIGFGHYTYFKATWFKNRFYDYTEIAPSITYDIPLTHSLSINTKLFYLNHKSESFFESSINSFNRILLVNVGNATLIEYFLMPRLNYNFYRFENISLFARIGLAIGYIKTNYTSYYYYGIYNNTSGPFFVFGAAGGFGIKNKITNSPITLFITVDSHYAYRGEQSVDPEYDGILLDFGVGYDL